jgi:predicted GNAT family N-acyltransferase
VSANGGYHAARFEQAITLSHVRRITRQDPLYPQACALREDVLLRPIGYDMERFKADFPGVEERLEHFVATFDERGFERVIGVAALLPDSPSPGSGRLMQMAVNLQRQGEGIGRQLVAAVESRAFGALGLRRLVCHAQVVVAGFFERMGWRSDGPEFVEAGVPHRRMEIRAEAGGDEL